MSTRNAIVAFDYDAREPDELSVRRAEPVVLVSEATDEPGWVLARLSSGRYSSSSSSEASSWVMRIASASIAFLSDSLWI